MNKEVSEKQMRKNNLKVFPIYKKIAWDYLFFYSINFLFYTQTKGISASDVILESAFYALFCIIAQIPTNILVDFLGRRNSIILGNVLNCIYILFVIMSRNFSDLVLAGFIGSIAYSIKNISEPSLLNASIAPSRYKSKIFAKINIKGASGFYIFSALSKVLAGYLFTINNYLPMVCCLSVLVIATIISLFFIEPVRTNKRKINYKESIKNVSGGFKYIVKADRVKALILCSALISSLLYVMQNCCISVLKDINISATIIGIVSAIGSLIGGYSSSKQESFHNRLRNRSLLTISLILSMSSIVAGVCGMNAQNSIILLGITVIAAWGYFFCNGMYTTIIDKYLRNFTNKNIDTKIFAANNIACNSMRFISGLLTSFLLDKMMTAYCLIIIGIVYTIIYILVGRYMKDRVGKNPSEYSKEELKYDEVV